MAVPRKNLLEAFRDAGNKPVQESEPSAGPFARSESPASAKSSPAPRQPRARLPAWLPWVCGVALAFVFGLALGKKSASFAAPSDESAAAAGDESAGEKSGAAAPPSQPSADALRAVRPEDPAPGTETRATPGPGGVAALYDERNRYTIVVATYGASRQDFAWATHDLLADQGLAVWPVAQRGDNYLVLVGAAPESKELESTLGRVRGLASWDKTPAAYADAYVERIDRIIDR